MEKGIIYTILQLVLLLSGVHPLLKYNWDYELLDVNCESLKPEIMEIECTKERLGPNNFAFSGAIEFKQNLTDAQLFDAQLLRSAKGNSEYIMAPFKIPKTPLTQFLNTYYKEFFMESVRKCAVGAPLFEKTFKPPMSKRRIEFRKCSIETDLNQYFQPGFYKLRFNFSGMAEGFLEFLGKVVKN